MITKVHELEIGDIVDSTEHHMCPFFVEATGADIDGHKNAARLMRLYSPETPDRDIGYSQLIVSHHPNPKALQCHGFSGTRCH